MPYDDHDRWYYESEPYDYDLYWELRRSQEEREARQQRHEPRRLAPASQPWRPEKLSQFPAWERGDDPLSIMVEMRRVPGAPHDRCAAIHGDGYWFAYGPGHMDRRMGCSRRKESGLPDLPGARGAADAALLELWELKP